MLDIDAIAILSIENAQDADGRKIEVKAFADLSGIPLATVYDILNRRRPVRANEVPKIVRASGHTWLADAIERPINRVGVPLPTSTVTDDLAVRCAEVALREFGDVLREVGEAAKDGQYTDREASIIDEQADEAIAAIHAVKRQIRALVKPSTKLRRVR